MLKRASAFYPRDAQGSGQKDHTTAWRSFCISWCVGGHSALQCKPRGCSDCKIVHNGLGRGPKRPSAPTSVASLPRCWKRGAWAQVSETYGGFRGFVGSSNLRLQTAPVMKGAAGEGDLSPTALMQLMCCEAARTKLWSNPAPDVVHRLLTTHDALRKAVALLPLHKLMREPLRIFSDHSRTVKVWHRCTLQRAGVTSPDTGAGPVVTGGRGAVAAFVFFLVSLALTFADIHRYMYVYIYIHMYGTRPPCAYIFLLWLLNSSVCLVQQTILGRG